MYLLLNNKSETFSGDPHEGLQYVNYSAISPRGLIQCLMFICVSFHSSIMKYNCRLRIEASDHNIIIKCTITSSVSLHKKLDRVCVPNLMIRQKFCVINHWHLAHGNDPETWHSNAKYFRINYQVLLPSDNL